MAGIMAEKRFRIKGDFDNPFRMAYVAPVSVQPAWCRAAVRSPGNGQCEKMVLFIMLGRRPPAAIRRTGG
jgi:hypothetical protein